MRPCGQALYDGVFKKCVDFAAEILKDATSFLEGLYPLDYKSWSLTGQGRVRDEQRVKRSILKNKKHSDINPAIEKAKLLAIAVLECHCV